MINLVDTISGYMHPLYPRALSHYGMPLELPKCQGWLLKRQIPDYSYSDAMGCYPIFSCSNWPQLHQDLDNLEKELVSLVLVADPFGDYSDDYLEACFPDLMIPFKLHYVIDLSKSPHDFIADHHMRNVRKALKSMAVEVSTNPIMFMDDWVNLYGSLVQRHQIRGIAAFPKESFTQQMQVPGLVVLRASIEGETVGMLLWYIIGNVAYYHLGAYSDTGYRLRASFGLFWYAITYFAEMGVSWLNLGAGAGTQTKVDDGLSRFKQGWSNDKRMAYLCGRIFDKEMYEYIVSHRENLPRSNYFPLYRYGEF